MKGRERRKEKPLSGINGVRGAISLLLAVLMTPFLSIACLLVEAGRYNSAVSILDEVLGVTSVSTLAHYDDYLQERWGLLALSQDIDVDSVYTQYLGTNSSVMGPAINIKSASTSGMYPLSETEILEAQLMEYCKLNAPTQLGGEIVSKVVSMTKLLEKLKELKNIGNVLSLLTKGVSTLDSAITMAESAEKLEEIATELEKLEGEYDTNFNAFQLAINTLIDNLKKKANLEQEKKELEKEMGVLQEEIDQLTEETTAPGETEPVDNEEEIEEKNEELSEAEKELKKINKEIKELNNTISGNRTSAATAQTNYATTISEITKQLTDFKDTMAKSNEAVIQIEKNIAGAVTDSLTIAETYKKKKSDLENNEKDLKQIKKDLEAWDGAEDDPSYIAGLEYKAALEEKVEALQTEIGSMELDAAYAKMNESGLGQMTDGWKESTDKYSESTIGMVINGFKELHTKVTNINVTQIKSTSEKITVGQYKNVQVAGYISSEDIEEYLKDQEKELVEGSFKALLDGLIAVYNSITGLSIFVEAKMNSTIDLNYYTENFGGLPGGASADNPVLNLMSNIGAICSSGADLSVQLAKPFSVKKLSKCYKDMKAIANNAISMLENMGKVVKNFLTNIAECLNGPEKIYITTYNTYNLSCRTDFSDASGATSITTMTGYNVGKDSFDKTAGPNVPVFGEIATLAATVINQLKGTGSDLMFTGAELEYMILGSTSEVCNQLYVFLLMYMIRLASSIPAIMADAEVQALAASTTLGYPVVIALYILLEPFVQTVLLVNGKDQPLIPTEVYLSPSGLPKLVMDLIWFCKLTTKQSEELSDKMIAAVEKSEGEYDYQSKLLEYQSGGDPTTQQAKLSLDFSYKDYCFVVLLLSVTTEQQIARLANLIQMETLCYYTNQKKEFTFDLRKSYTYLHTNVDAGINQIMPSLIDSSLFTVKRDHYRGY